MADSGIGSLSLDPLLQQTDPFPLFSIIIYIIYSFLHPSVLYLIYSLLCSIYSYSVFGIVHTTFDIYRNRLLPFTAFFLVLHSSEIWGGFLRLFCQLDLRWVWDSGLAEQGVLRGYLQPSVFGVFLLLSIYRFLRNDIKGAFLSLSVAAVFHANYLFIGGIFGIIYFAFFLKTEKPSRVIIWAMIAFLLTLPYLLHVLSQFLPAYPTDQSIIDSAVDLTRAGNPHLDPYQWLNYKSLLQVSVLVIFLILHAKRRLRKLSLVLTLVFGILSIVAFALDSAVLRSLNPWRASTVLFPIASTLVFWKLNSSSVLRRYSAVFILLFLSASVLFFLFRIFGKADIILHWRIGVICVCLLSIPTGIWIRDHASWPKTRTAILLVTIVCSISVGLTGTFMELHFRGQAAEFRMMEHVRNDGDESAFFIIPTEMTDFRMTTGRAVVADNDLVYGKSLPDQLRRIEDIDRFYGKEHVIGEDVAALMDKYCANSMVFPTTISPRTGGELRETYRDRYFVILQR